MANSEHVAKLREGVEAWNEWREKNPQACPDLSGVELSDINLSGADLSKTDLRYATLNRAGLTEAGLYRARRNNANLNDACLDRANLIQARLSGAQLYCAELAEANLTEADLSATTLIKANLTKAKADRANLSGAIMDGATLTGAYLHGAQLKEAYLQGTNLKGSELSEADLSHAKLYGTHLNGAHLSGANLTGAQLWGAKMTEADLTGADLTEADLTGADLTGASLCKADLVRTSLKGAILSHCHVYGISIWDVDLEQATQSNLVITPDDQPQIQVDNLRVAQFVYLLLKNENLRDVIDTIGRKGVLLLGRFTQGRISILERLREELRNRGFLPIIFNFDKPETKDFTETVRLLAGLSHFVIVDITNPRSAPLELQATVPECMVPFVPILQKGEEPFAMMRDLWIKHRDWVLDPVRYPSLDRLVEVLDDEIINPAKVRFAVLLARKAEELRIKDV